jgi:hypothetical protein
VPAWFSRRRIRRKLKKPFVFSKLLLKPAILAQIPASTAHPIDGMRYYGTLHLKTITPNSHFRQLP